MKKLIFRLLVVILSIYVAGSVFPLLASSDHAPAPRAPAPPPPASGSAQIDTKLPGPAMSSPRDYGGEGCCGGGGGPAKPAEPSKPGDSLIAGMDQIGGQYDQKGAEAKADVDAAYTAAEQAATAKLKAKYNADKILKPLDNANKRIVDIESLYGELDHSRGMVNKRKQEVSNYQQKYDEDLIAKTVYYTPLQNAKTELKEAEIAYADKLAELQGLKSQKKFLEEQKSQKLAGYEKEVAQLKGAVAAGKAKRHRAIDATVKKAKANAISKVLGAKIPEGSTSSQDIEAAVPSVGSLIKELSAGR